MKKVLALVLALILCLGVFTACGSKKNDAATDDTKTNDTATTETPADGEEETAEAGDTDAASLVNDAFIDPLED